MKKVLALALAAALLLSVLGAAFAETYTVSNPSTTVNVSAHTFNAYQILSAGYTDSKYVNITWATGVDDTAKIGLRALVTDQDGDLDVDDDDFFAAVGGATNDTALALSIANYVNTNNGHFGTPTAVTSGSTILGVGLWVLKDTSTASSVDAVNRTLLYASNGTACTVISKVDKPTLDKQVSDYNPSTQAAPSTDATDSADYDIGDDVPFTIVATTAADTNAYKTYTFNIADTQSAGLNLPEAWTIAIGTYKTYYAKKVEVSGVYSCKIYTDADYTTEHDSTNGDDVTTGTGTTNIKVVPTINDNDFTFAMTFTGKGTGSDPVRLVGMDSTAVTVTYSSGLNGNAAIGGDGTPNTATLTYSNNPNGDGTGTTNDTVIVFTYKLLWDKINESYVGLNGASFALLKKYYALPTGASAAALTADSVHAGSNGAWFTYNSGYYKLINEFEGTSYYQFAWTGISDGDYLLVETHAPDGYNAIDPISFSVTATHSETDKITNLSVSGGGFEANKDGGQFTFTKPGDASTTHTVGNSGDAESTVAGAIVNQSGVVLPSTGGIGTTIFYVSGLIMVLGAAVILVARRRADAE